MNLHDIICFLLGFELKSLVTVNAYVVTKQHAKFLHIFEKFPCFALIIAFYNVIFAFLKCIL